jgi:hypothetical protein
MGSFCTISRHKFVHRNDIFADSATSTTKPLRTHTEVPSASSFSQLTANRSQLIACNEWVRIATFLPQPRMPERSATAPPTQRLPNLVRLVGVIRITSIFTARGARNGFNSRNVRRWRFKMEAFFESQVMPAAAVFRATRRLAAILAPLVARLETVDIRSYASSPKIAGVAQWQSTAFVKRGLRVRIPPSAMVVFRMRGGSPLRPLSQFVGVEAHCHKPAIRQQY